MALVYLRQATLAYGEQPLFSGLDLSLAAGERVALLGRNGMGKSSLLKVLVGQISLDAGSLEVAKQCRIAYLAQPLPVTGEHTVYARVAEGLGSSGRLLAAYHAATEAIRTTDTASIGTQADLHQQMDAAQAWPLAARVAKVIAQLQLPATQSLNTLSGGWRKRVELARVLVSEPDILLLDEPTNHLDLAGVIWLENFLQKYNKTIMFVSHDRAFMQAIASRIVELEQGQLFSYPGDYQSFCQRREQQEQAREKQQALFDKRLAQEEAWVRQGVKARRTRNQGRVRALEQMRLLRRQRRASLGQVQLSQQQLNQSGKIVFAVEHLHHAYSERILIDDFSCIIQRGDKVGIVGANGVGKSTFLQLLLGQLAVQRGQIYRGTHLQVAYFDQLRDSLVLDQSVQDNVAGGATQVQVAGQSKHVMSYLQDFLFSASKARMPVRYLSGGERNRVLLAKLFAQPANVLVLDEPSNDLDIETLELLEAYLVAYAGTVLLVSHDRELLNNVVSSTIVFAGAGQVTEYVGGYDDWQQSSVKPAPKSQPKPKVNQTKTPSKKLTYQLQRELDQLPELIAKLEKKLSVLQNAVADPKFYQQAQTTVAAKYQQLSALEAQVAAAYQRWEELETLRAAD